jgi:hypothetical protein
MRLSGIAALFFGSFAYAQSWYSLKVLDRSDYY